MVLRSHFGTARRLQNHGSPQRALHQLVSDGRVLAAVRSRSQRRWLTLQARERLSLRDLAVAVAHHNWPVVATTRHQREFRGSILALSNEFVVISHGHSQAVYIPINQIISLTSQSPSWWQSASWSRNREVLTVSFTTALDELATRGAYVQIRAGNLSIGGVLVSVTNDVIGIAPNRRRSRSTWVSVAEISYVVTVPEP
jgi:hypothetical protein